VYIHKNNDKKATENDKYNNILTPFLKAYLVFRFAKNYPTRKLMHKPEIP
jgi:hypothetical protein